MLGIIILVMLLLLAVVYLLYLMNERRKRTRCRSAVLIPVMPDDDLFERRVRACYWDEIFAGELDGKDILLVINEPCANAFAARRLEQELGCVHTVHISSLKDYIIRNYY